MSVVIMSAYIRMMAADVRGMIRVPDDIRVTARKWLDLICTSMSFYCHTLGQKVTVVKIIMF